MNFRQQQHLKLILNKRKAINKALYTALNDNNGEGLAQAVHDISQGGVWQALVEMVGGDRNWPLVGLDINCPENIDPVTFLFSESGGFICEVLPNHTQQFEDTNEFIWG